MTQKERRAIHYRNRKENGLCPVCGNELDRSGYYCKECLEIKLKEEKKSREFFKSIGICPSCRKEKLFGDERQCILCRAKEAEQKNIERSRNREEYNKKHREYCRKREENNREKGLCPRCGKKPDDMRYKMCSRCRNKKVENNRNSGNLHPRSDRIKNGICYFCEGTVKEGYKVCERHYQMNVEKSRSQKAREARKKAVNEGILY